ncbi:myosin F, putative [Perkinsus marinus ATCC 50983]|uniref:Myosin F, putative n=1 Tax=Perkinsus marinus (strain ATCC 50983 / TXsc) TaxID=423536 RepID=C5K4N1_PERM5|nr:myosin F, putative [Perkinsus marinus ATCC 50983]EER20303.1 myosin F, putative [Perkinsus marinus ATCC 50983]|eukprot:XP_002788507.1 myosin F, putative [Perkinsus marinus ATCC 50983]
MLTVGISVGEINSIMNIIAAVLRLGNIRFRPPNGDSDASELDPASEKDFLLLMRLLGLDDAEAFIRALTTKTITTRMEVYHTPVSVHTAVESCDSLARQLYGLLFLRVVSRTNDSIGYDPKANLFCGVLDIFGFECFKQNSFEQLCINYTNERLQQFFNNFIFKMEEQLYAEEGIAWDPLDFPDNQDAVDLLADSRMGIFSLLDEECVIPGGSDKNFCSKLCHRYKEHRRFDIVKTRQDCFVVNHFAGPVEYDTEGFMDKNKDQMSYSLFKVMKGSSSDYVSTLFTEYEDTKFQDPDSAPSGKSKKKLTTISGEFKQQLNELMETVRETEPHFIRCIKPNPMNLPDVYDRPSVCEQLRYGGVLQAIQVSRAGYPVRISHEDCWLDYMQLVKGNLAEYSAEEDMSKRCLKLLTTVSTSLGIEEGLWEVGKTLVFFKQKAFDALQNARMHLRAEAATRIQAQWRGLRTRAWYGFAIICLVKMQALVRGKMARIRVANMRREVGALRIQSWWRMEKQRIAYEDTLRKVIFIQAVQRGRMARVFAKEYRINTAAARIQAVWKGWHVRRQYCALRASALAAQRQFRMRAAKMQLRRLKQEAKEVGSLLAKYQNAQAEVTMVKRKLAETEALLLQSKSENQQLKVGRETLSQRIVVLEGQLDAAVKKHEEEMEQLASQHTDELAAVGGAAALVGGAVAGGAGLSMSASGGPNATVAGGAATLSRVSSPRVSPTTSISSPTMSAAGLETATVASGGEAASVVRLRQSLVDANSKSEGLESENERLKQELARVNKEREESEAKYQTMLKNTVYQSQASTHQGPAQSRAVSDATGLGARNVDIQLVGPQGVGKSPLLAGLIQQLDPSKMAEFERNRSNLMAHYQLQFKDSGGRERVLKVLDCNGNKRAQHLVREWFARSRWVICVYDMSSKDSLRQALELMKEGGRMGANVLLFGNLQSVQAGKATAQVDVMKAKDAAASANALAVEGNRLMDAVRLILSDLDANRFAAASASPRAGSGKETVVSTTGSSASSSSVAVAAAGGGATPSSRALRADSHASSHTLSGALETFKGWFKGSDNKVRRSNGVLKASLRGNKTMRERGGPNKDPAVADIRPVQEIQDSETAVTCIAFGQEKLHRSHILLAAASKDGTVVVYRCYRTEMELARLDPSDFPNDDASEARQEAAPGAKVVLHSRLVGHSRAITSMFFNLLEDTIVTTSIDKSVRFWMVDTGEMLKTGNYRMSILHHHTVPVVAVATNQQDSLLASADSLGKIVLWRRVDFSHLEPASGETAGSKRARRLRECLPTVLAAESWDERTFENEGQSLWKCLRVGILDAARDSAILDEIDDAEVDGAWEFMLTIFDRCPRSSRQVLECVAIVIQSASWLHGFARTRLPCRLVLWRVKPSKRPSKMEGPPQVLYRLVSGLRAVGETSPTWDDLLQPEESVLANCHFVNALAACMTSDDRAEFIAQSKVARVVLRSSLTGDDNVVVEEPVDADGMLSSASNHEANEDCAEADRKDRVQRLIDATSEAVETA